MKIKTGHCWLCHFDIAYDHPPCQRNGCPMMYSAKSSLRDLDAFLGNKATAIQPAPVHNESRPIWELVIEDMKARDNLGRQKYGTPLQANNGRDALVDAYQEALDLAVYLKQSIVERDVPGPPTE